MSTKIKDRPARTYTTGNVTRALRVLAWAAVAGVAAFVGLTYDSVPDTVPLHFAVTGEADDWGPKWTIWALVGVTIMLVGLLTWLSTRPRWLNYPIGITETNAQHLYREGERMLVWISLAVAVVFWGAILTIYEIDNPLLIMGMIAMPVLVVTTLIRLSVAGDKKPADSHAMTDEGSAPGDTM